MVTVHSETKQEFRGKHYYLCGRYFQRKGKRLHRLVWETYNGPIPKGYHIHHKDGNRANNDIGNLECVTAKEHVSGHFEDPKRLEQARKHMDNMRGKASLWHGSEEGKRWHSELAKRNAANRKPIDYICTHCGGIFQTTHVYREGANRFCHINCKAKHYRRMMKSEG